MPQDRSLIFLWFHTLLQLSANHLANMVVSVQNLTYVGVLEHGLEVTVSNLYALHHVSMEDCVLVPMFAHALATGLEHSASNVSQQVY